MSLESSAANSSSPGLSPKTWREGLLGQCNSKPGASCLPSDPGYSLREALSTCWSWGLQTYRPP